VVGEVRGRLGHAAAGAGRADSSALAGEGDKEVVPAVTAAGAGKAVGEDAAFKVLDKRFAHTGLEAVVVALTGKLACAGQLKPGLIVT
jgi:hypothetical protein